MRLIFTIAIVVASTLCASSTSLPVVKASQSMVENAASPDSVDAIYADGGRQLRRVENPTLDDDESEEERTLGDKFKKFITAPAKKAAEAAHLAKIKQSVKDAGEQFEFLKKARAEIMNK
ncbi:RxLR effector protein [Phytophthora megakarya]|uniref:RxLR effector protein n=1 Tax=Phytophthora megakarya TaxID=4795 RepID=A0A225WXX3_9STRA|nr:RxLR effector protein [Phytophthora megakarya]